MLRQLGLSLALSVGGASLEASPRDLCAQVTLDCEKSETNDYQHKCVALAQVPRQDSLPLYAWKISAGTIVEGEGLPNVTIDVRNVKAPALNVKVWVTWPKAPRACRTAVVEKNIELH